VAFERPLGESYIEKVYDLNAVAAAGIGSLLFLGACGSLFFGWYYRLSGAAKNPMVLAGVGALATMAALLYLPIIPLAGFKLGLFLVGFFSSANIISYAVARDLYPKLAGAFDRFPEHLLFCRQRGVPAPGGDVAGAGQIRQPKGCGACLLDGRRLSLRPVSPRGLHAGGIDRIVAAQGNLDRHGAPMK